MHALNFVLNFCGIIDGLKDDNNNSVLLSPDINVRSGNSNSSNGMLIYIPLLGKQSYFASSVHVRCCL